MADMLSDKDEEWKTDCEDWPDDESRSSNDDDIELLGKEADYMECFDLSMLDAKHEQFVETLYGEKSVNCCENGCNKLIPKDFAVKHRLMFEEMNKAEQDAVILSHLQQSRRAACMQKSYDTHTKRGSVHLRSGSESLQRMNVTYFFCALPICKKMYFFLHSVGSFRYESLCKHFDTNGISPRVHKLANKTPARSNVLGPEIIEEVVRFIKSFADNFGLPLPGRMPNFKNFDVIKLPSVETKTSIYHKYCEAITHQENPRFIARSTFVTIWKKYCPYVTITKPANDLCGTCRENQLEIIRSANLKEDVKQQKLDKATEHLDNARKQREYYNRWRELTAQHQTYNDDGAERTFGVFSFDFAENLSYPFNAQQIGPVYFKTTRKCSLFGVHNESNHYQENFLIDESDLIGKGANTVISLLHHFLNSIASKDTLVMFADNAVGQNKNNAVLQYFLWRVLSGRNRKILYNFLIVGHTKFSPDRSFGMLKKKYSKSTIDTIIDLADCIRSSSHKGLQGATITHDPRTNAHNVIWSDWVSYLNQLFSKLPGLTKCHHFIFSSDGSVKTKEYADSEPVSVYLERSDWTVEGALLIEDIISDQLSLERQWYLYENVRGFVIQESNKDLVAPRPSLPKPINTGKYKEDDTNSDSTNRTAGGSSVRITRNQKKKLMEEEPVPGPSSAPEKKTRKKAAKK